MTVRTSRLARFLPVFLLLLTSASICNMAAPASFAASGKSARPLALLPPMGWNDWAHYQCGFTAQTILDNAKALVSTGLAARGYNTVTIDDCWMQKTRDAHGNLQADPGRFPQGIKPVADAVHKLGLKFGIYEDAGYETCGKFAGSGTPEGGGQDHFVQDTRLFASWGVDYLKLDGCNVYVPGDSSKADAYRKAYAAQSAALKKIGRPIAFSESAPAYFQGTPDWYDTLIWVRNYGELWREGTDMANFDAKKPNAPRFHSVLWNYAYNLPLGRFQKPGNWNDADFIIGGDAGITLAETRSQMALWSMMSAPLILSSNLDQLDPQAVPILENRAVIAIDQDVLGRMATLVRRSPDMDLLFKPLHGGDYAVAVLNRGSSPLQVQLHPADFGFATNAKCRLSAQNLWSGAHQSSLSTLQGEVAADDTAIWRIHPAPSCGRPMRSGTITMATAEKHHAKEGYSLSLIASANSCLAAPGHVEACTGTPTELWIITPGGGLRSAGRCLAVVDGQPAMQACAVGKTQRWTYTLAGTLVSAASRQCLSNSAATNTLSMEICGNKRLDQIWSLPN